MTDGGAAASGLDLVQLIPARDSEPRALCREPKPTLRSLLAGRTRAVCAVCLFVHLGLRLLHPRVVRVMTPPAAVICASRRASDSER